LTEDAVRRLAEAGMETMNIDIKGGRRTYRRWLAAGLGGVLSTARAAKSLGVHIEFTYLVIPGLNFLYSLVSVTFCTFSSSSLPAKGYFCFNSSSFAFVTASYRLASQPKSVFMK